jgi:hypothetical protein
MSSLEDEIRDTLRSEATRLREVRPLRLSPAPGPHEPRAVPRAPWARRLRAWQGPAVAVAVVVLVAATLVTLKSLRSEPAAAPVASPGPVAGPIAGPASAAGATPRYYVELGWSRTAVSWAIIVGDEQAGKTIATFPLPKGNSLFSAAASGAADDRTFVVSAAPSHGVAGPPVWYLVRIFPGSADPVRVTKLPIKFPVGEGVRGIALSGDGTELAVVATAGGSLKQGVPPTLQVYSVATGRLQHSWPTGFSESAGNPDPVTDLSWVGDSTVGFAVTYSPKVREEVRTLDVSKSGGDLLADSRLVWSQYVPAAPHGTPHAPQACDTPFLSGNGHAVVCGNSTYSASDKRLSAVWLAYPLATPTRPRVIGSVKEPLDVSSFNGTISVDWANPSGTKVIGSWNPSVEVIGDGGPGTDVTNYEGVIGNATVKPFPPVLGPKVAW